MGQMGKAKIIVLRCLKHSESDLLVHAIDSEGNRRHFLAKSALKSKKRFGGGLLEPTHYLEVLYKEHGGGGSNEEPLLILLEAKMIRDFRGLRAQFDRLDMGLFFLKLVLKLTRSGAVEAKEIFDLLGNALSACEQCISVENLKLQFQAKLLHSQGILPDDQDFSELVGIPLSKADSVKINPAERALLHKRLEFEISQI